MHIKVPRTKSPEEMRPTRGGPRKGAGRPPGSGTKRQKVSKILERHADLMKQVISDDISKMTPLDVMLRAMALEASAGRWLSAASVASTAAPYVHPRLAAINLNANVKRNLDEFTDEELASIASAATDHD